jgi:hypothetical protein
LVPFNPEVMTRKAKIGRAGSARNNAAALKVLDAPVFSRDYANRAGQQYCVTLPVPAGKQSTTYTQERSKIADFNRAL